MIRVLVLLLLPMAAVAQVDPRPANTNYKPAFANQTDAPALPRTNVAVQTLVSGLDIPWGMAALGDGRFLLTERIGNLRIIDANGRAGPALDGLPELVAIQQGGLLDVAVSPRFADDRTIFWTYSKPVGNLSVTAAAKGILGTDDKLSGVTDIFVGDTPGEGGIQYGSRIIPMADGTVWITTGDRGNGEWGDPDLVLEPYSTIGKVIRINADGSAPADNPFVGRDGNDLVWSLGHRNMQGAAIGPDGLLWTIEHGPRGGDELNQPQAGLNYGWPAISYGIHYDGEKIGRGRTAARGYEQPVYYWDPVIAPTGMAFYDGPYTDWQGDLLIAALSGALVRLKIDNGRVVGEEWLLTDVGRIRDVEVLDDGRVLLALDSGDVLRIFPR